MLQIGSSQRMSLERHPAHVRALTSLAGAVIALLSTVACLADGQRPQDTPIPATTQPAVTLQSSPYPYATPLPPPIVTGLDGVYTKVDPKAGTPVPCLRCPDYAPEGGIWQLSFDKGIYRIFHTVTGWRSVGSFTVSGDRLTLFNDPACATDVGAYTWRLADGELSLEVVEDPCAIQLRAKNLTAQPWLSCQPPTTEAAITDHWPKPPGCD